MEHEEKKLYGLQEMCEYGLKGVCSYLFDLECLREKYPGIYSEEERIPIFKKLLWI